MQHVFPAFCFTDSGLLPAADAYALSLMTYWKLAQVMKKAAGIYLPEPQMEEVHKSHSNDGHVSCALLGSASSGSHSLPGFCGIQGSGRVGGFLVDDHEVSK
jgi:hypothetical protein